MRRIHIGVLHELPPSLARAFALSDDLFRTVSLDAGLSFSLPMKQDITSKLNIELDQEIVSERQVVYILVEARKLLEQQTTLDQFRAFKLCSDWAVHPQLQSRPAIFPARDSRICGITAACLCFRMMLA